MHVVATAGHVDHGKSTLVRALTGTDPDRLEEERRRGLSIELGYAWTEWPETGEVAFVDVPGHERFVTTALAGVGPVPVVLFVVAADDPWMPQAAEHLAALDALGVSHGVLVVTRSDLADPAPALERARAELARTTLRDAPAVAVSAVTGSGLGELRSRLVEVLHAVPPADPTADPVLWVDRRFTVRGTGTVVTGTLRSGTIAVDDELEAAGTRLRVRRVECLGRERTSVSAVARVALALGGRVPGGLSRGTALVRPGTHHHTEVADVRLTGTDQPPRGPVLHVGSTQVAVRARPLGEAFVRLTWTGPVPLRIGDRAVLRDPGSRRLWGVTVADPDPPGLSRRGDAARRAAILAERDGTDPTELATRGVVRRSTLRRLGSRPAPLPPGTVESGDWLVAADQAAGFRERIRDLVTDDPEGLPMAAVARRVGLPDDGLLADLLPRGAHLEGGRVRTGAGDGIDPRLAGAARAVAGDLASDPFAAPTADRLRELGLDGRAQVLLHRAGAVLRVADGVLLAPGADDLAMERLAGLPQPFTTSEARKALGTSRRVVLPLLAHLDATGRTVRLADDRRRLRGVDASQPGG